MRMLMPILLLMFATQASATQVVTSKSGDMQSALDDLSIALANNGFELVKVQPLDLALVRRGFDDPGIRLAFVAKEAHVRQALAADPALLSLLPLRLTLSRQGDRVVVSSDDLAPWQAMLPAEAQTLHAWQEDLAAVLKDYARQ